MVTASIGSIATRVQDRVEDIPTAISGAVLINIVDDQRLFMEEYTGLSIGSVAIAEKFQPAMTDFATAQVLDLMQLEGSDAKSIKLDVLTIDKGEGGNLSSAGANIRGLAMDKLKVLGKTMRFRRVLG